MLNGLNLKKKKTANMDIPASKNTEFQKDGF